jgi:hypothetical protein
MLEILLKSENTLIGHSVRNYTVASTLALAALYTLSLNQDESWLAFNAFSKFLAACFAIRSASDTLKTFNEQKITIEVPAFLTLVTCLRAITFQAVTHARVALAVVQKVSRVAN